MLWEAYFYHKHEEFLRILEHETKLIEDDFGKVFVPELKRTIIQGFIRMILKSYKNLSLSYLATELHLDQKTLITLMSEMINSGQIYGLIDEIDGVFDNSEYMEGGGERDNISNLHEILRNTEKVF